MIKFKYQKASPVKIVADGLISAPEVGEGRFIPMILLNTTGRPDIDELLRVHEHTPPGDVITQWAIVPFKSQMVLHMQFKKPIECQFEILFDIDKQGALVDAIMHAQAVYIQSGQPGESVSGSLSNAKSRILAEIPRTDNFKTWDKVIHKVMTKKMRLKGLDRTTARQAASDVLKTAREMWNVRRS